MKTKPLNSPAAVNALLAGFSALVFFLDTLTPQGAAEWISYVLPVMLAGRVSRPRSIIILTLMCSSFIILGFFFSPAGSIEPRLALINRLAGMAVLWVISALLVLHRRSQDALTRAEGEVETRTKQTAELARDKAQLISEIEARKLIERQRSDFYSMVTHDLKSPLSVIMGYAELLLEKPAGSLDADDLESVRGIRKSSEKLLDLVETFLDVSRLETGSAALSKEPEDAATMLGGIAASFGLVAGKKGIEIRLAAQDGLPVVMMDRKYVERAVNNLVSNALSYTPGGGKVTLGASLKDGLVEIYVADTGPGIPPDEQSKVFDKFYRARGSAGSKGSGLGLAIVKGVAEAHGGRVELESSPGRGCRFSILLPVTG